MQENNGLILYDKAVQAFEQCNYDTAVKLFIEAYNYGVLQDEILENLYNCFIIPNQDTFLNSFITSEIDKHHILYENTSIDFIPVSDTKYYIYDKNLRNFSNPFEFSLNNNNNKSIDNLLIIDDSDITISIDTLLTKNWRNIYIILTSKFSRILSLCKIPDFSRLYMKNTIVFEDEKQFFEYFIDNPNEYLPKKIIGNQMEKFQKYVLQLHNNRIKSQQTQRNNILLSICIPSYNRGLLALRNVNHILSCKYDAEIEIIVSNNGSELTVGYDEISKINDSRLKYYEFNENMGSAYNFRTVLDKAIGKFAVLCSDEDVLILEKLPDFLNFLSNCYDIAIIRCSGVGNNFEENKTQYFDKLSSYMVALNSNYITGLTFNTKILKSVQAISKYDHYNSLPFAIHYPHCCIAFLCISGGNAALSDIVLWESEENELETDNNFHLLEYMKPESRLEQQNSCIEFINSVLEHEERAYIPALTINRISRTFFLVDLAYSLKTKGFIKEYNWIEVCLMLYIEDIELVKKIYNQEDDIYNSLINRIKELFEEVLFNNSANSILTERQQCIQKITATIILHMINCGQNPKSINVIYIQEYIENILYDLIPHNE